MWEISRRPSEVGRLLFRESEKALSILDVRLGPLFPLPTAGPSASISGPVRTIGPSYFGKITRSVCCSSGLSAQVLDLCFCEGCKQHITDRVVKIGKDVCLSKPRTQL
ncbi:hypothetical protein Fot_35328 [Forsythia ovata]|uniref:FLZ-type domain-containing protein n=1 Tax=Forsythia ovata TaxID=205694 RepID=A0ABD1SLG9_9LAMI